MFVLYQRIPEKKEKKAGLPFCHVVTFDHGN